MLTKLEIMKDLQINDIIIYCDRKAKIIAFDKTHALLKFENGNKLCILKSGIKTKLIEL